MRLGQLARKVNVKPTQIISFLEKEHKIIVEDNLNSKIEEESLSLVLDRFKTVLAPVEKLIENVNTSDVSHELEDAVIEPEVGLEIPNLEEEVKEEIISTPEVLETNPPLIKSVDHTERLIAIDEDGEEIELRVVDGIIKAPKKELEGFKVIGKIDLPQKKKAITFIVSKGDNSTDITDEILDKREELAKVKKEQYLERKKKRQNKTNLQKGRGRKVLTELELKEKANKLAVEKQIKNSKLDKNLKKKYYKENIQPKSTSHKKKKKKTPSSNGSIKPIKGYDKEPTTRLGKLWKWFNT